MNGGQPPADPVPCVGRLSPSLTCRPVQSPCSRGRACSAGSDHLPVKFRTDQNMSFIYVHGTLRSWGILGLGTRVGCVCNSASRGHSGKPTPLCRNGWWVAQTPYSVVYALLGCVASPHPLWWGPKALPGPFHAFPAPLDLLAKFHLLGAQCPSCPAGGRWLGLGSAGTRTCVRLKSWTSDPRVAADGPPLCRGRRRLKRVPGAEAQRAWSTNTYPDGLWLPWLNSSHGSGHLALSVLGLCLVVLLSPAGGPVRWVSRPPR